MSKRFFAAAFALGLAALAWITLGFVGTSWLALGMTALIAGTYVLGAFELTQFRAATAALGKALDGLAQPPAALADWLAQVPPALREPVRLRVEGERAGLPGPALTPYLVGLLVMLGMLGTFLGLVVTFKGTVFALEGSTDLQAIRASLSAPIKGLGLSFGTSVAGVAASAMLGLMSAIARRERLDVARTLDARIASLLRPFSLAHQRQETLRALQAQAGALPAVVDRIEAMMERLEQRSQQLDAQLLERQTQFQRETTAAYGDLAQRVGASLQDSLAAGARAAGDSIRPVVESAMAQVAQDTQRLHARLGEVATAQVDALSQRFDASARSVADTWGAALRTHAQASEALTADLQRALAGFTTTHDERSTALLASVQEALVRTQADQARAEQQRLQAWTQALQGMGDALQAQWTQAGDAAIARHDAVCQTLEATANQVAERASGQAAQALEGASRLLDASQALVQARTEAEARWVEQHGQRMDTLAALWRTELAALRHDEQQRGQAAVERLGTLQAAVAQHLATLGAALEDPLNRLLHTASEVPQAAAGVIAQLRQEMSQLAERDNAALAERTALLEQLGTLLQAVNQATGEQRTAIEGLVASATAVLDDAGGRYAQALDDRAGQAAEAAAHVTASAVELSALAEAFGQGVQAFQASNDKLTDGLLRIETSLSRSTARSDEQLAYYVAQAREVIDLSIASQQGLVDNLRHLAKPGPALALADGEPG